MTAPSAVMRQHTDLYTHLSNPDIHTQHYFMRLAQELENYKNPEVMMVVFAPHSPAKSYEEAAKFSKDAAVPLLTAKTYQITEEMVDAITGLYHQASGFQSVQLWEMPAEEGFVWLDKPVEYKGKNSLGEPDSSILRAISWQRISLVSRTLDSRHQLKTDGVRIFFWLAPDDVLDKRILESEDPEIIANWRQLRQDMGDLVLFDASVVVFGAKIPERTDLQDSLLAWFHTMWLFLEMEIVFQIPASPERQTRKAAERAHIKQSTVNVVTLRRIANPGPPRDPSTSVEVEWSCRWLVRGHWRHIDSYDKATYLQHTAIPSDDWEPTHVHPVCAKCPARITYVKPFIKGPDDKPLRATQQLLRLAR